MRAASRLPVTSDTNALLRLQLVARKIDAAYPGDPDVDWIWSACRDVLLHGGAIGAALGIAAPGWRGARIAVRQDRRDDLLRRLYRVHYSGMSIRAAALAISAGFHRVAAQFAGARPDLDGLPPEPATERDYLMRLLAEGHTVPARAQLSDILRRAAIEAVAG